MFKTLLRSLREYKLPAILSPILISGEVVLECIIPMLIADLVDEIQKGCDLSVIIRYGGILVVMALLSLAFGMLAGLTAATASCGFARNLRRDMFFAIQDYSFANIDKFSTSSLVTRLTTDITNVQNAFMMLIRTAVRSPFMLVFAFIMAFKMGGKIAIIFFLVIPVLGSGLFIIMRKTMPLFRKVFKKYDALNNSIQENIKGIRVVKSFVREKHESGKFGTAAEDVCRDFTKAERILAFNAPLMQFCMNCVMIFVMTFGSYVVITSTGADLEVGQMSALLTYNMMMLSSLMMLSMIFVMLTLSAESCKRIAEVIDEKSTLTSPENAVTEVKDGSIEFKNVSFRYSEKAEKMALCRQ